ncbi:tRNA 2-thiouridine(34) synthase MnmA [Patescibacteria group bacterium]|nr:tRNA 2-thiouridine(34) synthase MnmA [Patescibacteria group bacterium]
MERIWNKHKNINKPKVIMAMSGGVDSSVAAKLLVDKGYEVVGIFLHFWKENFKGVENFENKCCSIEALADARRVCDKINIPLYTLNFSKNFKKQVVNNFLHEYKQGKTPNPCVRCNKLVKLGYLIEQAKKLGFDYVASGHYVKKSIVPKAIHSGCCVASESQKSKVIQKLYKAKDKNKDQSYFLYTLNQKQLKHLLFPLSDYTKQQVRQLAKKFKLSVAEKKESQEICFIPEKKHNEFLKRHLKLIPGKIKTLDNKIIGNHHGLPLYTIGQRKGVEVGGIGPFYVAKMDYKTNVLYVVNNGNDKIIYNNKLIAKNVSWVAGIKLKFPLKCNAVIRYGHKPVKCIVTLFTKNKSKNYLLVKFFQSQRAIAPGQSVVFYNRNEVLGGGVISL